MTVHRKRCVISLAFIESYERSVIVVIVVVVVVVVIIIIIIVVL